MDTGFFIGILMYIVLFGLLYMYSKKMKNKQVESHYEGDNTLRYTLSALFLALCWMIIAPIWFPDKYNNQTDFYRILIIITTIITIVTAYRLYVKKRKDT